MKFKRRFDGFLSEEHIKQQLLTLALILVASFFIFWGVSAIFFPGDFSWRQIIALYLDPGVFDAYSDKHTWFPLVITFVGIFVFTALLITVFTNVFSNISDAYRKGERRYSGMKDHTLILGANRMLIGMLTALKDDESVKSILIMTSSPVESLRDNIEAYFGDKKFMKKITFYFDERNNEQNLIDACAKYAKEIFIIGEDGEVDHDSVSISCCEKLEKICKDSPHSVHCFLVLDNQSSADIYHYHNKKFSQQTKLLVDVVDIKEYVAEQTLLGKNGDDQLPIDGKGIKADTEQYVHFIISGMTPMAKAMAITAAHLCHFPNFDPKTGRRKTVITFVDYDRKRKRDIFVSEHQNLFDLSHYSDISFDADGNCIKKAHKPDEQYGDFLDIEWEFIDADISSPEAKGYLSKAANDCGQQLAIAICQESQEDNMSAALHLPAPLYDKSKSIPIYVHLWKQGDAITKANATGQFGNIYCFGTGTSADRDPLFRKRLARGQRVNYVYSTMSDENPLYSPEESLKMWYNCKESDKFSSIYCANSLIIKQNSFGEDLTSIGEVLYEVEHRRWLLSVLMLGQKAIVSTKRDEIKAIVLAERMRYPKEGKDKKIVLESGELNDESILNQSWRVLDILEIKKDGLFNKDNENDKEELWSLKMRVSPSWRILKRVKDKVFLHIDIDSYEGLVDKEEKEKDETLMINTEFIFEKTTGIKKMVN